MPFGRSFSTNWKRPSCRCEHRSLNKLLNIHKTYTDTYPKTGQVTATVGSCIRHSLYASPVVAAEVEVNFLATPVDLEH